MKLLCVNYEFPPLGGGAGRALAQIASYFVKNNHQVHIITSIFQGLKKKETLDGYEVFRIPTYRRFVEKCSIFEMIIFMLSSLFFVTRHAKKWRPDFSIAFFTLPSGLSCVLLKWFFGIPYIISLRGGDVPGFMEEQIAFYHKLLKPLIRYMWRNAEHVVANSQGLKDLALLTDPNLDIKMIPNGINPDFFNRENTLEEKLTQTPDKIKILTVGRLSPQKSIDTIINSLSELKRLHDYSFEFQIIGDGPERKSLEKLVNRLKLENEVKFLGWIDQSHIQPYYEKADLFVLASIYEGMPNVVLEAMSKGLPILGTRIAGTEELVNHGVNGYLFEVKDIHALTDYLKLVIEDKSLRNSMSFESVNQAQNYSWEFVSQEYLNLCQKNNP